MHHGGSLKGGKMIIGLEYELPYPLKKAAALTTQKRINMFVFLLLQLTYYLL